MEIALAVRLRLANAYERQYPILRPPKFDGLHNPKTYLGGHDRTLMGCGERFRQEGVDPKMVMQIADNATPFGPSLGEG